MDLKEKLVKYHGELEQAKKEYKELQEFYKNKKFSNQISNGEIYIFNKEERLFDGYYKSLTFTVYSVDEMCELSRLVDIYDDNELLILVGFDITE